MNNVNILVVEDESLVAKDIQNRLKKIRICCSYYCCFWEEAIKQVTEFCPDLVLMDIQLKGKMDGIEAAQKINISWDIPVIYLTANADDTTLERLKGTNPFGYILKPFKEKELKTLIEITLTKHRLERELKQSEQWLTTVLKSIGDAVITSDRTGIVNFMNPVAEALTGWKQEDAVGKDVTEVFNITHAEHRTKIENPLVRALQEGVIVGISEETVLITRNGVEIPIDDSAAPIKDDKGTITGVVLVFRDITEFKKAKEALQKQIEQERLLAELEKINELKDDFLSTVSHELRTPIANMRMAIQMLKLSSGLPERSQRYLEILQAECARESDLIDNLLDLQRLETTSYLVLEDAVSLQDYLPSIIESFRTRIQQREQTIQLNLPPDVLPLVIDQASLERILVELINNACKYTCNAGEIVLSVRQEREFVT